MAGFSIGDRGPRHRDHRVEAGGEAGLCNVGYIECGNT